MGVHRENPDSLAPHRRIWLAAASLPVLAFLYAYDVPYWDEWAYVAPIVKAAEGRLSWADFVVRINEHIYVTSTLIALPLARATHWDLRYEIAAILLFYAATFALMLRALNRVEKARGQSGSLWAAPIVSCLLFSFSQYAVWNWGLHLSLAAAVFFALAAIHFLGFDRPGARRVALAGLCGWAATFAIGGGLAVWPAGLAVIVARRDLDRATRIKCISAWLIAGAAAAGLYLAAGSAVPEGIARRVPSAVGFLAYVAAFLGGPLAAGRGDLAVAAGIALLIAVGVLFADSLRKESPLRTATPVIAGWLCIALVAGGLTALKHAHEGVYNAISSRFLPWGTLAWCALAAGVYAKFPRLAPAPRSIRAGAVAVLLTALATSAIGAYRADEHHDVFLLGRRALIENPTSDDLKYLHPAPDTLKGPREELIRRRLTAVGRLIGPARR